MNSSTGTVAIMVGAGSLSDARLGPARLHSGPGVLCHRWWTAQMRQERSAAGHATTKGLCGSGVRQRRPRTPRHASPLCRGVPPFKAGCRAIIRLRRSQLMSSRLAKLANP